MLPVLFNIGQFPVHTYGVLIAIGFLLAVWVVRSEAKRIGWPTELIVDFCFLALLIGFIGARIVFIFTRIGDFMADPKSMFYVWEGGLVFYGGPLLVAPWTIWFTKRHKLSFFKLGDISVQGLVLAHAFGRLGCIAAGCCFGKPTGMDWGFQFYSELVPSELQGVPLHPTQLYESLALFALFFYLRLRRKKVRFAGQLTLEYFLVYPIIRSIVEIFRGDVVRGFVIDDLISTSQFISIIVFLVATITYVVLRNKATTQAHD